MTLLLAAAASLLLVGSYLVLRTVIESDTDERRALPQPLPVSEARDGVAQHRRAA